MNHTPSKNDQYYFEALSKTLDRYISYDRIVLIRDFNSEYNEVLLFSCYF